jgi:hypothetical protein
VWRLVGLKSKIEIFTIVSYLQYDVAATSELGHVLLLLLY